MFTQQSSLLSMIFVITLSLLLLIINKEITFVNGFSGYELGNYIAFTADRVISYSEASMYCSVKIGTELATITNEIDNDDAVTVSFATSGHHGKPGNGPSPGYVWFGLNDKDNTKEYKYQDGTEFNEGVSFNKFVSNTPDKTDDEGHCAALLAEPGFHRWHDFRCDGSEGEVRGFVCNLPKTN